MFINTDVQFYGGNLGSPSWGGWGSFQSWQQGAGSRASSQASAAVSSALPTGTAVDSTEVLASNPYELNPASLSSFLRKNVSEFTDFSQLDRYLTPELKTQYQDWLGTQEALSTSGAGKLLNRLREGGQMADLLTAYQGTLDAFGNPRPQYDRDELVDMWRQRGISGSDISRLLDLRSQGVTLESLNPDAHGVSKHRRYWEGIADLVGRAGVGF